MSEAAGGVTGVKMVTTVAESANYSLSVGTVGDLSGSTGALLVGPSTVEPCVVFHGTNNKEIIRIKTDGRVFWHGREIESDDEFKAAMRELLDYLKGVRL